LGRNYPVNRRSAKAIAEEAETGFIRCHRCEQTKPRDRFYFDKKKERYCGVCKDCRTDVSKRDYRKRHEHHKKRRLEWLRKKRAEDREAYLKDCREYNRNNYHRLAESRKKCAERRKRRFFRQRETRLFQAAKGQPYATASQLARLWMSQQGMCALTGRKLDRTANLDHIIPRSRGGGHEIDNLRWVIRDANLARNDMVDEEFLQLCWEVLEHKYKEEGTLCR
jgi:5-methylcytosine-specific restriction endonuclease McrA